jgi:3-phenylpropionate/trans-cinnamate dioxygenase ferredoxin subunit
MTGPLPIGAVDDFPVGTFRIMDLRGREVGILRMADGTFRAVRNRCPHKAAPVCKGIVGGTWLPSAPGELIFARDGGILVCPWHGFEYDLDTGEELFRPGAPRLRTYPVEVADGQVVVSL